MLLVEIHADLLDLSSAVAYLNVSLQAYTGRPDGLVFDFSEIGPMHTLARSISKCHIVGCPAYSTVLTLKTADARFGCTLTARLADMRVLRYEVVPEYRACRWPGRAASGSRLICPPVRQRRKKPQKKVSRSWPSSRAWWRKRSRPRSPASLAGRHRSLHLRPCPALAHRAARPDLIEVMTCLGTSSRDRVAIRVFTEQKMPNQAPAGMLPRTHMPRTPTAAPWYPSCKLRSHTRL